MPNPTFKTCPKNTWKLVATNVMKGFIKISDKDPNIYLETYRLTGEAAPTEQSEGIPVSEFAEIRSSVGIDVYIMAVGENGKVRVDI